MQFLVVSLAFLAMTSGLTGYQNNYNPMIYSSPSLFHTSQNMYASPSLVQSFQNFYPNPSFVHSYQNGFANPGFAQPFQNVYSYTGQTKSKFASGSIQPMAYQSPSALPATLVTSEIAAAGNKLKCSLKALSASACRMAESITCKF